MKNPLISVIVPVYKAEAYLERCVNSIINQTYKNLEIILVDDGSPDKCGEMCDEFAKQDSRIRVIHKENGGQSSARNAALDIMLAEPERIDNLWEITNYALAGFRNMGCEIGNTSTPIIPLYIRDNNKTFMITRELFEEGLFVNPVVSPAVPSQDTLIRFSLMATHTKEQLDYAFDKIEKVFKKYEVIK